MFRQPGRRTMASINTSSHMHSRTSRSNWFLEEIIPQVATPMLANVATVAAAAAEQQRVELPM